MVTEAEAEAELGHGPHSSRQACSRKGDRRAPQFVLIARCALASVIWPAHTIECSVFSSRSFARDAPDKLRP